MQGLIVYSGKYGATRQYAEWLSSDLTLPIISEDKVTKQQIETADYLLMGTSVYYGKLRIRTWLKKNEKNISGKKLFLFVVNATAPGEQEKRNKFVEDSVSPGILNSCEIYFLPGRLIHKQLTFIDRLMLKMAERSMKDPVKRNAMRADIDEVKKEHLAPLIDAVRACFGKIMETPINEIC